ncbi:hypothetical protein TRV_04313 [Trichophyton verrucosum HKI 0517]|uniref:Uncharacterized protein n=1 Tax=Trichophyton verrucosum (strain HKI 0517) TaxID=663202 RepID=D4DB14_TRIVH|nr:uncharacterized protein TRV_04313 [Trichophyton verrucosum HKI 0517]EFE40953.1 hypothetical protein TRV_04313 [Trichophyton verrucosum HKI 0517]
MLLEEGRSSKFVIAEAALKSGVTLGAILADELKENQRRFKGYYLACFQIGYEEFKMLPQFSARAILLLDYYHYYYDYALTGEDYALTELRFGSGWIL